MQLLLKETRGNSYKQLCSGQSALIHAVEILKKGKVVTFKISRMLFDSCAVKIAFYYL